MDRVHWSLVPSLLAAGWLALSAATLATVHAMPTGPDVLERMGAPDRRVLGVSVLCEGDRLDRRSLNRVQAVTGADRANERSLRLCSADVLAR